MCTNVSFITDCKSDDSDCKFRQPLQSRLTAIRLTVTRGGRTGWGGRLKTLHRKKSEVAWKEVFICDGKHAWLAVVTWSWEQLLARIVYFMCSQTNYNCYCTYTCLLYIFIQKTIRFTFSFSSWRSVSKYLCSLTMINQLNSVDS